MSQNPDYYSPQNSQQSSGMAVASMVLGIVALVLFCIPYVSFPCGVVGLVLGVVAGGKARRGEAAGAGMARAGVVCSTIAAALAVLLIILAIVGFSLFGNKIQQLQQQQLQQMQQMQKQQQQTPPATQPTAP
jgi:uncharacterized membrane protein